MSFCGEIYLLLMSESLFKHPLPKLLYLEINPKSEVEIRYSGLEIYAYKVERPD